MTAILYINKISEIIFENMFLGKFSQMKSETVTEIFPSVQKHNIFKSTETICLINLFRLSQPALRRTLLFRLDDHGIWLNYLLLDVSLSSECRIFRSGTRETTPKNATHRWQ